MSDDEDDDNLLHFNPWRDFNDAPLQVDVFGDEPDPAQIATFVDVVFGYCEGLIPIRGFIDKGQGFDGKPHNIWIEADDAAPAKMATFASWAWREGAAVYVIPGTVAEPGQAKAADVRQMQTIVVDLDMGDIDAKLRASLPAPRPAHARRSRAAAARPRARHKRHVWWRLTEPAEGEDVRRVCRLRERHRRQGRRRHAFPLGAPADPGRRAASTTRAG